MRWKALPLNNIKRQQILNVNDLVCAWLINIENWRVKNYFLFLFFLTRITVKPECNYGQIVFQLPSYFCSGPPHLPGNKQLQSWLLVLRMEWNGTEKRVRKMDVQNVNCLLNCLGSHELISKPLNFCSLVRFDDVVLSCFHWNIVSKGNKLIIFFSCRYSTDWCMSSDWLASGKVLPVSGFEALNHCSFSVIFVIKVNNDARSTKYKSKIMALKWNKWWNNGRYIECVALRNASKKWIWCNKEEKKRCADQSGIGIKNNTSNETSDSFVCFVLTFRFSHQNG